EVTHGELSRYRDIALFGTLLADNHAKERGLARAIRPHEPHLVARIELETRFDEQELLAVLLRDVGERNHGTIKPQNVQGPGSRVQGSASSSTPKFRQAPIY